MENCKLKLTRDDLRSIEDGESKTFKLASASACNSGKASAYQFQYLLGCKFRVQTNYAENTLTITRSAL